jgi:hypothetical protein
LEDFKDSFEMDMEYADAYRLWIMSSFDDDIMLKTVISDTELSKEWKSWINEQSQ